MASANKITRKDFIGQLAVASGIIMVPGALPIRNLLHQRRLRIKFGLVTYLWGKEWDIPTMIDKMTRAGVFGVELRVEHAHGVTPEINKDRRKEIRKMFRDSPVEVAGIGTNQQFDYPDQAKLRESMDRTRDYIILSKDIGGTGVKVKPNQFHPGVPKSRTVEQIGRSLNQLAHFAAGYGQQIRLEVHGHETQEIEVIKDIMDVADHPGATVCWNSNPADLAGDRGLEGNFNLLKDRLGSVAHVRELDDPSYPYEELIRLLVQMNYRGWVMLEATTNPADKVAALIKQREIFDSLVTKAINS